MKLHTSGVSQEVEIETTVHVDIPDIEIEADELAAHLVGDCDEWEIRELIEKLDELTDDWDFTRRMRDYFVAEMAKHETPGKCLQGVGHV